MPDLDEQLTAGRQRVLDTIEQPPFGPIARRARALRRRRALAPAAIALLVSTAAVTALINRAPAPPVSDASASPGAVYAAAGITINGLPALPVDLPGNILDVEFVDAERGALLTAACAGGCKYTYATTTDGGRTWQVAPLPAGLGDVPPMLVPLGDQVLVLPTPTRDDQAAVGGEPATALPGLARLQLVKPGECGGMVDAWVPRGDGAVLVPLVSQPPDLMVCWASPVRAGDGAWWVGGVMDGAAAVAVTRDGGRTWTTTRLGDTGAGARVAVLGQDVYATVLGPTDELLAVYHSSDGGRTFTRVTHSGMPIKIGGELVPLYDGRLLLVNGDGMGGWFLGKDHGATWTHANGLHPTERIARTSAGYVAYKMTTIYTAFSVDGSTWRKINAT